MILMPMPHQQKSEPIVVVPIVSSAILSNDKNECQCYVNVERKIIRQPVAFSTAVIDCMPHQHSIYQ